MPVFYQHNINETTRLGIWHIEETESFFLNHVPLQRAISHPHKRLQHLAGRYLLQHLFPGFPYELISIADTRKPFLSNEAYHFSISHCGDYAAALVSTTQRVGIDIELVKPSITAVRHKFLSEEELALLQVLAHEQHGRSLSDELLYTICWSAKESIYKWFGNGGVDFKRHMPLQAIDHVNNNTLKASYVFSKDAAIPLTVSSEIFDKLVLSVVAS